MLMKLFVLLIAGEYKVWYTNGFNDYTNFYI